MIENIQSRYEQIQLAKQHLQENRTSPHYEFEVRRLSMKMGIEKEELLNLIKNR